MVSTFGHFPEFVITGAAWLAPLEGILAFFSDELTIEVQLHIFDVLMLLAVYPNVDIFVFGVGLVVLWVLKPAIVLAMLVAGAVPAFY